MTETNIRSNRKTREGLVVSSKMNKTIVVALVERVRHPKYDKFITRTKKLYAHDEAEPRLAAHRAEGGRIGFWRDGQLILAQEAKEQAVLSIQRPAVARLLKTNSLSQNDMLIAACAAWAMDMGADLIRAGVKSYGQTPAV